MQSQMQERRRALLSQEQEQRLLFLATMNLHRDQVALEKMSRKALRQALELHLALEVLCLALKAMCLVKMSRKALRQALLLYLAQEVLFLSLEVLCLLLEVRAETNL